MQDQGPQIFKVTNNTDLPVYRAWTVTLLTPTLRAEWEDYRKTTDYLGDDPQQQGLRKRIPEAIKLREWVNSYQIGTVEQEKDPRTGKMRAVVKMNPVTRTREAEYMFELPAKHCVYLNEEQTRDFRPLEKKAILQDRKNPKTSETHYEGFLEIEPVVGITEDEMYVPFPVEAKEETIAEVLEKTEEPKTDYSKLSYNELQIEAKKKGLPAFGVTRENLIKSLNG